MPIRYTRVGWQDAPSTDTPIDAANLNHMDNGILALSEEVDTELPLLRDQINDVSADIETQIDEKIPPEVSSWLTEHVDPVGSAVVVDDTLSIEGAAADAKKTGDELTSLKEDLSENVGDLKSAFNETVQKEIGHNKYEGGYVSGYLQGDGSIHSSDSWRTTDLIDIGDCSAVKCYATVNGSFRLHTMSFVCSYGETGSFIKRVTGGSISEYTKGENVKYIRFSYEQAVASNLMVVDSSYVPTAYEAYTYTTKLVNSAYPKQSELSNGNFLDNGAIESQQTDFIGRKPGKNLYSGLNEVNGYLQSNGSITGSSTDWKTSDYIYVYGLDSIVASWDGSSGARADLGFSFLTTYGEDKSHIRQVGSSPGSTYEVEDGVYYIRFCHETETDIMVEEGTIKSAYEPYHLYNYLLNAEPLSDEHFEGKRWAVFGDSLTEKNARAATSYYDYIAEELGVKIVNYGASGTGYARTNSNFMTRMLNIDPTAFDVLTIFGSFNDAGAGLDIGEPTDTWSESGTNTLCGFINQTIDNFYSVAPYKPMGLVTPCPWAGVPTNNAWGNQYCDAIIAIAKLRGIPCMDLFRESGLRPWSSEAYREMYYKENGVQDDGTHPNSLGHKIFLYPHFREFLKTILF